MKPESITNETENNQVIISGMIYDTETGECLGAHDKPEFHITDRASAEWVMQKILDAEIEAESHLTRLRILQENIERQAKEAQRRADGLKYRFSQELSSFAKTELEGKKTKTYQLDNGAISFRMSSGGLKVRDKDEALNVAKNLGYSNAVKVTETFLVSALSKEQKSEIESMLNDSEGQLSVSGAFEIEPPRETVSIKTGVKS